MYNNSRKRQNIDGYATDLANFTIADLCQGGYCAFMGNSIINMITTKTAVNSFFAISTMLTFHKHTPFHRLSFKACEYKKWA